MSTTKPSTTWVKLLIPSIIIVIILLCLSKCNNSKDCYTLTDTKIDTLYVTNIDTVYASDTITRIDTVLKMASITIPSTTLLGDIQSGATSRIDLFKGEYLSDSLEIMYWGTISNCEVDSIQFAIEWLLPQVDSIIHDTIRITKVDSVFINTVNTVEKIKKVRGTVGGDLGYTRINNLPSVGLIGGLIDKKDRTWFIRVEPISQSFSLGLLAPIGK